MQRLRNSVMVLIVLAGVLMGCSPSSAPEPDAERPPTATLPPSDFPDVDAFMAGLLAQYDIPGAGLAVVQNGAVRYVQGYGVRSTATNEPVTPETLFAVGSATKSFTVLGVMQLVDQGRIRLDDPVSSYVPGFTLADASAAQNVTVRHLLAQTTGLAGGGDAAWVSGAITTLSEAVAYAATLPIAAAPGSAHIYSNYNYAIAGYLIEQVTGQSWEAYTRDHILAPLAMTGATFDLETLQQTPNYALPHRLDIREGMRPADFVSLAGVSSAGALNLSAREMANYLLFQLGDGTFDGESLLSPALLNEMHTQQIAYPPMPPVGPTGFQTTGYALGWFVAGFNGLTVLWHNGSIDGFYTMVMFIPSENIGVVVLSNAGLGTGSLFTLAASLGLLERFMGVQPGRDVVAALNEEAAFDPLDRQTKLEATRSYEADPDEWAAIVGDYQGGSGSVRVEAQDDHLYILDAGSRRLELVPFAANNFVAANRARDGLTITYTFVTNGGAITLLRDGVVIGQKAS
ncbi:MAG: beta-lactamase family protein [Chloroflexi bacterium]|nr:beta-lactamase family protein [Chloroflexota bacterium]